MIRTILATSESATRCAPPLLAAAHLARRHGAVWEVLHAAPEAPPEPLRCRLEAACAAALPLPPARVHIASGPPAEAILRQARASGADLVVMGPHREGAGPPGRLGGTAEALLARLDTPVMIVTRGEVLDGPGFARVLAAVDFSPACGAALAWAAGLPGDPVPELHLFHLLPVPPFPKYSRAAYAADTAAARRRLADFGRRHAGERPLAVEVEGGGLPGPAILRRAAELPADLVVLGTHTRDRRGKWYAGSVMREVAAGAPCPVVALGAPGGMDAPAAWQEGVTVFSGAGEG